jgi:hypothetical protein
MIDKKISTIEDLAIMMQGEFSSIHGEFSKIRKEFHDDFTSLRNEVLAIKIDLEQVKSSLIGVAYRFDIEGLEKRLEKVEEKLGIKNQV